MKWTPPVLGSRRAPLLWSALLCAAIAPLHSFAQGFSIDFRTLTDPNALSQAGRGTAIIQGVGLLTAQRPMGPATPVGTSLGLEAGVEATLVRMPPRYWSTLVELGAASESSSNSALPFARIQAQKGLSPWVTLGAGAITFLGIQNYSVHLAVAPGLTDEGLVFAGRFGFSWAKIETVMTRTWNLELLTSRRLDFAEPYIGLGVVYTNGSITADVELPGLGGLTLNSSAEAVTGNAFGGIQFKIAPVGLQVCLEGSYSLVGGSLLGAKVGISL